MSEKIVAIKFEIPEKTEIVHADLRFDEDGVQIGKLKTSFWGDELEPAPPKDWRPYCWFNEEYDDTKPCTSETKKFHSWCCKTCPWNSSQSTQINDTEVKKC